LSVLELSTSPEMPLPLPLALPLPEGHDADPPEAEPLADPEASVVSVVSDPDAWVVVSVVSDPDASEPDAADPDAALAEAEPPHSSPMLRTPAPSSSPQALTMSATGTRAARNR
jgi:hypothetical protein